MLSSMSEPNVPAPPVSDAYEIAKAGGKHSNWYKQQLGLPASMLERAIKSFQLLVGRHESWIQNPTAEYPDFYQWDPRRQRNLIEHHWPADIARHRDFIRIIEGILKERGYGNQ